MEVKIKFQVLEGQNWRNLDSNDSTVQGLLLDWVIEDHPKQWDEYIDSNNTGLTYRITQDVIVDRKNCRVLDRRTKKILAQY